MRDEKRKERMGSGRMMQEEKRYKKSQVVCLKLIGETQILSKYLMLHMKISLLNRLENI
jgi:hypothetical protein